MLDDVDRGRRLADALDDVPARAGEVARPLTAALVASERYGAPVVAGLERLAGDVRRDRRRRAEEAARRVPVKLLFPLVTLHAPRLRAAHGGASHRRHPRVAAPLMLITRKGTPMLKLFVYLQTAVSAVLAADDDRRDQRGQATAEYALVLLGVAAVALLVGVWAAKTNLIGKLFDLVFRKIFDKA